MYCTDTIDTEILHCNDCKECMDLECGNDCPFWHSRKGCVLTTHGMKCGMKYSLRNQKNGNVIL